MYLFILAAAYNCSLTLEGILSAKKLELLLFHSIITHIYHIKFEVSLHFRRIWPTVAAGPGPLTNFGFLQKLGKQLRKNNKTQNVKVASFLY